MPDRAARQDGQFDVEPRGECRPDARTATIRGSLDSALAGRAGAGLLQPGRAGRPTRFFASPGPLRPRVERGGGEGCRPPRLPPGNDTSGLATGPLAPTRWLGLSAASSRSSRAGLSVSGAPGLGAFERREAMGRRGSNRRAIHQC